MPLPDNSHLFRLLSGNGVFQSTPHPIVIQQAKSFSCLLDLLVLVPSQINVIHWTRMPATMLASPLLLCQPTEEIYHPPRLASFLELS